MTAPATKPQPGQKPGLAIVPALPPKSVIQKASTLTIKLLEKQIYTPIETVVKKWLDDTRDLLERMGSKRNIAELDTVLINASVLQTSDRPLRDRHVEHVALYEEIDPLMKRMNEFLPVMQEADTELSKRDWATERSSNLGTEKASQTFERVHQKFQDLKKRIREVDATQKVLAGRTATLYSYLRDANNLLFPTTAGLGSYFSKYLSSFPTSAQLREILSSEPTTAGSSSPARKDSLDDEKGNGQTPSSASSNSPPRKNPLDDRKGSEKPDSSLGLLKQFQLQPAGQKNSGSDSSAQNASSPPPLPPLPKSSSKPAELTSSSSAPPSDPLEKSLSILGQSDSAKVEDSSKLSTNKAPSPTPVDSEGTSGEDSPPVVSNASNEKQKDGSSDPLTSVQQAPVGTGKTGAPSPAKKGHKIEKAKTESKKQLPSSPASSSSASKPAPVVKDPKEAATAS